MFHGLIYTNVQLFIPSKQLKADSYYFQMHESVQIL